MKEETAAEKGIREVHDSRGEKPQGNQKS